MTYTKKQVLPALHHSDKITDPDLPDVGNRNYTSTILKYSGLALPFPQLKTDAKTIVAAINELYGRSNVIPNPPIGDGTLETESGEIIECENGVPLESEQSGGGSVVGPLNYIQIDGDIYSVSGGGGGSRVIPNPSYSGYLNTMKTLQIDDVVFNLPTVVPNDYWSAGTGPWLYGLKVGDDRYRVSTVEVDPSDAIGTQYPTFSTVKINDTIYTIHGYEIETYLEPNSAQAYIYNSHITTDSTVQLFTNNDQFRVIRRVVSTGSLYITYKQLGPSDWIRIKVRIT